MILAVAVRLAIIPSLTAFYMPSGMLASGQELGCLEAGCPKPRQFSFRGSPG